MTLLLVAFSFVCAVAPMATFAAIVWWLDRYDREPVGLIGLTFAWGAMGAVVLAIFGSAAALVVLHAIFGHLPEWVGVSVVAPAIEEPAKALFLVFVVWNRAFDNTADGFVYGAVAGLGFAMTENLVYFVGASGDPLVWGGTVVLRTFYSGLMHATATAFVGAAVGLTRFRGGPAMAAGALAGLAVAFVIHATWNGLIALDMRGDFPGFAVDLLLFPFELAAAFALFQFALAHEAYSLREELERWAARGLLPLEHLPNLVRWWGRREPGWAGACSDPDRYVAVATQLAHRSRQVRLLGSRADAERVADLERLVGEVRGLLAA